MLIHGVDERERGHSDEEHNDGGDDCPDDLQRGVVGQLLRLQLLAVVELGGNLHNMNNTDACFIMPQFG